MGTKFKFLYTYQIMTPLQTFNVAPLDFRNKIQIFQIPTWNLYPNTSTISNKIMIFLIAVKNHNFTHIERKKVWWFLDKIIQKGPQCNVSRSESGRIRNWASRTPYYVEYIYRQYLSSLDCAITGFILVKLIPLYFEILWGLLQQLGF